MRRTIEVWTPIYIYNIFYKDDPSEWELVGAQSDAMIQSVLLLYLLRYYRELMPPVSQADTTKHTDTQTHSTSIIIKQPTIGKLGRLRYTAEREKKCSKTTSKHTACSTCEYNNASLLLIHHHHTVALTHVTCNIHAIHAMHHTV